MHSSSLCQHHSHYALLRWYSWLWVLHHSESHAVECCSQRHHVLQGRIVCCSSFPYSQVRACKIASSLSFRSRMWIDSEFCLAFRWAPLKEGKGAMFEKITQLQENIHNTKQNATHQSKYLQRLYRLQVFQQTWSRIPPLNCRF